MNHRAPVLLLSLLTLVGTAAGCGKQGEELEAGELGVWRSAIIGGEVESGRPELGVVHAGNLSACSGTLISARAVLTAAHCVVSKEAPYQLVEPVNFYPGGLTGIRHTAASVIVHPDYAGGNQSDLAVVVLDKPVTDVAPMPIATTPPVVGEQVTLLGFGKTGEETGTFGTKRRAVNAISSVEAQIFRIEGAGDGLGNICNGDSGGPTLALRDGREVLIGVHSTKGGVCGEQGNDMRADVFLPWIAELVEHDLADGSSVGRIYPWPSRELLPAGTFGSSCEDHADCDSNLCALDHETGERFCTALCDLEQSSCPMGATCHSTADERAICGLPVFESALDGADAFEGGCTLSGGRTGSPVGLGLPLALLFVAFLFHRSRG